MKIEKEEIMIYLENGRIFSNNQSLRESFIGEVKGNKVYLHPIEVFYLSNIRRARVFKDRQELSLSQIFQKFYSSYFFVKYNVYRDWKDRGLFITFPDRIEIKNFGKSPIKKYPSSQISLKLNFPIFFWSNHFSLNSLLNLSKITSESAIIAKMFSQPISWQNFQINNLA